MSNDPIQICKFYLEHDEKCNPQAVSPCFVMWSGRPGEGSERSFTAKLAPEDLAADDVAFTSCPGIYQAYVPKKSELRITFFGSTFFGVRILSQELEVSRIDFRADFEHNAQVEVANVSGLLLSACKQLASRLGLIHGSFDFIERPDGGFTFLEINEMGQFLFMEEWLPELRLLAAAVEFARAPAHDFVFCPRPETDRITFKTFLQSQDFQTFTALWQSYVKEGKFLFTYPT